MGSGIIEPTTALGERPEKGIIAGLIAHPLANGIHPDVPANGFDGFLFAKEVVVPLRLPKAPTGTPCKEVAGFLLEGANEEQNVRR